MNRKKGVHGWRKVKTLYCSEKMKKMYSEKTLRSVGKPHFASNCETQKGKPQKYSISNPFFATNFNFFSIDTPYYEVKICCIQIVYSHKTNANEIILFEYA